MFYFLLILYKAGNAKKDGLQKYHVRINYVADNGQKRQITCSVYGIDVAKNSVKKYEVREITLEKSSRIIKCYILPILKNVRIDKLSTKILNDICHAK